MGYNISLLKALTFSHVRPALSIRLQTLTGRLEVWLFPEGTEWELRNAVKQLPTFLKHKRAAVTISDIVIFRKIS